MSLSIEISLLLDLTFSDKKEIRVLRFIDTFYYNDWSFIIFTEDANGDTFPGPVVGSGVSPACQLATLTWMFCLVVRAAAAAEETRSVAEEKYE